MRTHGACLASLLTTLTATTAVSAAEPAPPIVYALPSVEGPREVWYGWQTLTIAGASLGLGTVPAVFFGVHPYVWPLSLSGMVFGGPIVHWKHGRVGRG
ncbi:MAG TPA: hypothetical protein VM694_09525, partial [Polyangium sp.]|nr:hypothetical protein [Polyangium sp.]